jgi:hypothetical protein
MLTIVMVVVILNAVKDMGKKFDEWLYALGLDATVAYSAVQKIPRPSTSLRILGMTSMRQCW